ncbi:MAG: sugar-binding domain-containing protein [Candidatus Hermodarchaeota archaeon]
MVNNESKWVPVKGQIMTRWAQDVSPECPLPEYPRPQLKRKEWLNLNGLWEYAIRPKHQHSVKTFDGKILVPFALESALSGVCKKLSHKAKLWYRRHFTIPENWKERRILLHFGAVDWEATIWINDELVGSHQGGFVPFSFEITEFLRSDENELIVSVWDPTDKGRHECGKQSLKPYLVFYSAVSGIWQTVWLEPVPQAYFQRLRMTPNTDNNELELEMFARYTQRGDRVQILVKDGIKEVFSSETPINEKVVIKLTDPKLWSPQSPFLYDLTLKLVRAGEILDEIESYFAMRKISLIKDKKGFPRIALNNRPIFQYGLLDQGYWPDGLYTAPTDEALLYDIKITKTLGFNMIRKHVKVEPARWYYHCDKLGVLVWQDMPNGGIFNLLTFRYLSLGRWKKTVRDAFCNELQAMINFLYNSPAIVTWVPFNEGWGQFETERVVKQVKSLDSSRLIDAASGWFDKKVGDIKDIHIYPGPKLPEIESHRAAVIGEFGGLGLKVKDHIWLRKRIYWAYRTASDKQELFERYSKLISQLLPMINQGLCAAVYTQTTDIEGEINGLLTYDREITKIDPDQIAELHQRLLNRIH